MAVKMEKKVNLDKGDHYRRDRKLGYKTRNIVKGIDGGIRGADYSENQAQHLEELDSAAMRNLRASQKDANLAKSLSQAVAAGGVAAARSEGSKNAQRADLAVADAMDARNVVIADAAQAVVERIDPKAQLEDERLKRKLLLQEPDEDEDEDEIELEDEEEEIEEVGPFADHEVDALLEHADNEQLLRLVRDPQLEMRIYGTVRLLQPEDMREALGSPLRVARHLRILSERMLASDEFSRQEVIHYISGCVLNLGQDFGASALRSFCMGVGIGAVYPLEVMEHVAKLAPKFLPRTTICPFLAGRRKLMLRPGKAFTLRCDPALKITGFALKGGGDPGYQFAPRKDPGEFGICFLSPGDFRLIMSAVDPYGFERLQELRVVVRDPSTAAAAPEAAPAEAETETETETAKTATRATAGPKKKKKKKKKKKSRTDA